MQTNLDFSVLRSDIATLDKRLASYTDAQLNKIIDDGLSELCSVMTPFSSVEIVDVSDQECEVIDIELSKWVLDVYDLYLTEDITIFPVKNDVTVIRDTKQVFRDQINVGLVHVDMDEREQGYDYLVVKYFYLPTHESTNVKITPQLLRVLDYAVAVAAYDRLHDVERSEQKRAGMKRLALSTIYNLPEDFDYDKDSMFPSGV